MTTRGALVHAGILWLRRDHEDDLVEVGEVTQAARRDAPGNTGRLLLPRLRAGERPHRAPDGVPLAPWAMRLSRLARSARRTLGDTDWRVEWGDDGDRCRPDRVRPAAPAPTWQDTLVRIDPNATLTLPGVFGAELAEAAVDVLFDRWRRHLPTVPTSRPLIVGRDARVYLNATLVTDLLRRLGLPTTAVGRWITAAAGPAERVTAVVARLGHRRIGRLSRTAPALVRAGLLCPAHAVASAHRNLGAALERVVPSHRGTTLPAGPALRAVRDATVSVLHAHATLLFTEAIRGRSVPPAARDRLVAETVRATRALRAGWLARADLAVTARHLADREALWILPPAEVNTLLSAGPPAAGTPPRPNRTERRRSNQGRAGWLGGDVPFRGPGAVVERAPRPVFVRADEEEGLQPST